MGEKKRRKELFLREHPWCCFCGGLRAATTTDHLPPRSVFSNKKWPDGYEFPACDICNNGSSGDDALFAMTSRIYGNGEPAEQEEFSKLAGAFHRRFPGLGPTLPLRAVEVRAWMRSRNLMPPKGETYSGAPLMRIPPVIQSAIQAVGRKLIQALHYKHAGKIVPVSADIRVRWYANVDKELGMFPAALIDSALPGTSGLLLNKDRQAVDSQFGYRFGIENDGSVAVYAAFFRRSFALLGALAMDPGYFAKLMEEGREAIMPPA